MIAIDGLQVFANRLSRLDIGRAEADAVEQAAQVLEARAKAIASSSTNKGDMGYWGCDTAASVAISHHTAEYFAAIGTADPAAAIREFGSARMPPQPILGTAARQVGPALAERIGQMFAQLMSEVLND